MYDYGLHNKSDRRQWLVMAAVVLFMAASVGGLLLWRSREVQLLSVQTGSMAPHIMAGDAVLVRPVATDDLREGDVISFYSPADPGVIITHRVIGFSPAGQAITRGDSNAVDDGPVDDLLIVGRVERQLANVGYAIDFIRSRAGLAVLVYLPALVIITGELRRLTYYFRPAYRHVSRA